MKFLRVSTDKWKQGSIFPARCRFEPVFWILWRWPGGNPQAAAPEHHRHSIVLLLLFIGAGILTSGYYINKSVFHAVFEERESNKARNIHLTIESIVSTEVAGSRAWRRS